MKRFPCFLATFTALALVLSGCDLFTKDEPGPNDLGGNTNLELTKVGNTFPSYFENEDGSSIPALDNVKDSIWISKNDNGIVTTNYQFTFDQVALAYADSLLGTSSLPLSTKLTVLDKYLEKYGATIDTTDKNAIKVRGTFLSKNTSEGLQEFINSRGDLTKPFTVLKYGDGVGAKYEFTDKDGIHITRTITSKSTTDDYPVAFWLLKVSKVEERKDDPFIDHITYVGNHKYGLVGVQIAMKNGKKFVMGIFPPTL